MVWGTFHRTSNPTEYFTRLQHEITTRLLCNEFFILAALLLSPQPCLPLPSHLVVFGERFSAGERARPPSRLSSLTHLSAFPPQPSGSVRRLKPPTAELSPPPHPPPASAGRRHVPHDLRRPENPVAKERWRESRFFIRHGPETVQDRRGGLGGGRGQELGGRAGGCPPPGGEGSQGGAAGRAVPGVEGVKGDDDGGPGLRSGPGGRRVGPGRPVDRPGGRRSCSPPGPRSPAGFLLFLLGTFFFFFSWGGALGAKFGPGSELFINC